MSTLPLSNASSSNHQPPTGFDPQEPIWTAYLLDELDGAERAALDRIVAASPAAQAWIKEMRALAGDLKVGLATEPLPALTADQRQGLAAASRSPIAATLPLSEGALQGTVAIPRRNEPAHAGSDKARSARWRMWGSSLALTAAVAAGIAAVPMILPQDHAPALSSTPPRSSQWFEVAQADRSRGTAPTVLAAGDLADGRTMTNWESQAARQPVPAKEFVVESSGPASAAPVAVDYFDAGVTVEDVSAAGVSGSKNRHDAAPGPVTRRAGLPVTGKPAMALRSEHLSALRSSGVANERGAAPASGPVSSAAPASPPAPVAASAPAPAEPNDRYLARGNVAAQNAPAGSKPESHDYRARGLGLAKGKGLDVSEKQLAAKTGANRELAEQLSEKEQAGSRRFGLERKAVALRDAEGEAPVDELAREQPVDKKKSPSDEFSLGLTKREEQAKFADEAKDAKTSALKSGEAEDRPAVTNESLERDAVEQRLQQVTKLAVELQLAEREAVQLPALQQVDALNDLAERYDEQIRGRQDGNTESYDQITDNSFQRALGETALSTFSIDVDTAAYTNLRRYLNGGSLPPRGAIRIEELVNYFPYSDAAPTDGSPFSARIEIAECPWQPQHRLARVALKGREIAVDQRPVSNLVFLVDVSGSMQDENKLPLVREGLRMLVNQLGENDRVAIVVYAGASGLVLPSTSATNKQLILSSIDNLQAGGSTNGGAGIELAYKVAVENFIKGGANRVILCTDGDFNVGVTSRDELVRLVEEKAKANVFATILGFGMGNLKDSTLEQLADKGNGQYGYIDSLGEARKQFVDQLSGTLVTIAKDVKIQLEFNPAKVAGYRLIGYENRVMANQDFRNDAKDAGEIGAGHSVTALYEIIPAGQQVPQAGEAQTLKYQVTTTVKPEAATSNEWLTLRLRHKAPEGDKATEQEFTATDAGARFGEASIDFRWSASVAAFGMVLRDSPYNGMSTLPMVKELAEAAKGTDAAGYRAEFVDLVKKAEGLLPPK
jgi:Ca-activated chloride channel family protein